jgi:hypothetical protein
MADENNPTHPGSIRISRKRIVAMPGAISISVSIWPNYGQRQTGPM